MAIISCWSSGTGETGKTSALVAITTLLAINHNYKILVLDTNYNDYSYQDCYWKENKTIRAVTGDGIITNIASGMSGLAKAILSNKTSPEIVTIYTKIVFKNRLEILTDTNVSQAEYETHKTVFKEIANIANRYYDLVFIDIASNLSEGVKNSLLDISDLILVSLPQKIRNINQYINEKSKNKILRGKKVVPILGRYDSESKYTSKNVARYIKEKRGICAIPYNTLFFEACNEGKVADYFIKYRNVNPKDKNAIFINEVEKAGEEIVERLKE